MKKKIIVTGGDGRFARILKKNNKKLNLFFASKKQCNILNLNSITRIIKKIKPQILILSIDSPGGTVSASNEIYKILINFKANHSKEKQKVWPDLLLLHGNAFAYRLNELSPFFHF